MSRIIILVLIACAYSHNPMQIPPDLIPTIVTAWYPNPPQNGTFPSGQILDDLVELLELPINLIIFGNENLKNFVMERQQHTYKTFIPLSEENLTKKWYYQKFQQLQKSGLKKVADRESEYLAYSRMYLLKKAAQYDPFDSNELIWIDFKSFQSPAIRKLLEAKNLVSLITNLHHHFFFVTQPKNNEIHAYPNVQKTYYLKANFTTFVGGTIFGGRKQAIATVVEMYDDLLRVIMEFDKNLWNEDAVLSMLADRCYYLTTYLSLDAIFENTTQTQLNAPQDSFYFWLTLLIQIGMIAIGVLLVRQIIALLKMVDQNGRSSQMSFSSQASGRQMKAN